jgi:hypothetical protein
VVRSLKKLGVWTGRSRAYALPAAEADLKTAVLLQTRDGGRILAVLKP